MDSDFRVVAASLPKFPDRKFYPQMGRDEAGMKEFRITNFSIICVNPFCSVDKNSSLPFAPVNFGESRYTSRHGTFFGADLGFLDPAAVPEYIPLFPISKTRQLSRWKKNSK
jgi:hypothetical protein